MRQLPQSKPRRLSLEQLQSATRKGEDECSRLLTTIPFGLTSLAEEDFAKSMDAIRKAVTCAWSHGFSTALGDLP